MGESSQLIVQVLDCTCDYPDNMMHYLERFSWFDTNIMKMTPYNNFTSSLMGAG